MSISAFFRISFFFLFFQNIPSFIRLVHTLQFHWLRQPFSFFLTGWSQSRGASLKRNSIIVSSVPFGFVVWSSLRRKRIVWISFIHKKNFLHFSRRTLFLIIMPFLVSWSLNAASRPFESHSTKQCYMHSSVLLFSSFFFLCLLSLFIRLAFGYTRIQNTLISFANTHIFGCPDNLNRLARNHPTTIYFILLEIIFHFLLTAFIVFLKSIRCWFDFSFSRVD